MDSALAEYYEKLRLITSGPVWSGDRLAMIVRFNLGQEDHLLEEYEAHGRRAPR